MTEVVIGKKTFYVLPPESAPSLEPSTTPRFTNTSTIPIPVSRLLSRLLSTFTHPPDKVPEDELPPHTIERYRALLEEAFTRPGACQVDLNAGDSVLVPQGWWHSAEGADAPGVGVGAWFR